MIGESEATIEATSRIVVAMLAAGTICEEKHVLEAIRKVKKALGE